MDFKSDYSILTDSKLIELMKQDNAMAFEELYQRYQKLLYLYAYKRLQDKDESKDIVHDIFLVLWNSRKTFELTGTLPGFLYKATLNKMLSIFRHKKITEQHINSFVEVISAQNDNTDYLIREREITIAIEKEVNNLPGKMREIFLLRRKSYMSASEVALKLDISEHTVNTQLYRAIKILKVRLGFITLFLYFFTSITL